MKKLLPFCFLLLPAAQCAHFPGDEERFGLTKDELEAGPSYYQMMGAFLNDRNWRMLNQPEQLERGKPVCPAIWFKAGKPVCVNDSEGMETYRLKEELQDKPYRVEETVFYCREEKKYWYHYKGGPQNRDAWLGPYPMSRQRPKTDD